MSYHHALPLADLTAQTMQNANQTHRTRKQQAHAYSQGPAVVIPKSFSHNPYVGVIPSSVDEMVRVLEYRRQQQTQMRRTHSSPNFFNTAVSPQSPLMGGGSPLSPMQSNAGFPRIGSAPTFFEEPESRTNSPLMMNADSFAFGESTTSFGDASFTSNSPTMQHAPVLVQQQQRNNRKQQPSSLKPGQQARPSDRRQIDLPVPASVTRQQKQQQLLQQKQVVQAPIAQPTKAQAQPQTQQRPRSPPVAHQTSTVNSSTESVTSVITKVYENGRPVPRMMESDVAKPKTVVDVSEKVSAVSVNFRNHQGNFRTSRLHLCAGDYVIVDGDRGCDLGVVCAAVDGADAATAEATNGSIQRVASEEEVEKFHALEGEEAKACEFARLMATRHLNNKLTVERVSFQFDRQKLTLWYRAAERVYFVPLLKALNQEYKCRIWMERVEDLETAAASEETATDASVETKE